MEQIEAALRRYAIKAKVINGILCFDEFSIMYMGNGFYKIDTIRYAQGSKRVLRMGNESNILAWLDSIDRMKYVSQETN